MAELGPRRARRGQPLVTDPPPAGAVPRPRQTPSRRELRGERGRPGPRTAAGWVRWTLAPLAALALAGWAASCLVEVDGLGVLAGPVVALATATPFVAVAAIPLVTLALRRRRWASAAVAVLAAAFPWWFALGYAAPSDVPLASGGATVRLMIVDARQGQADAADIVAAAATGSADLLVVTELSGTLAHDLTLAGLDQRMQARTVRLPGEQQTPDAPDSGLGVWSRIPVDDVESVAGTQWPALAARVGAISPSGADGAPTGPVFTLITAHVATPVPDGGTRWAQDLTALRTAAAAARARGGPVVLLGNLNATPWHADFRRFAAVGLEDGADTLGQGLRPTWPTWSPLPLLPLDHVLVGGGVQVQAIDSVIIGGTDHRGLQVTLRIPATG